MTKPLAGLSPLDSMADVVAALRVASRFYRFFVEMELKNRNAARALRKVCGLTDAAEDVDVQDDPMGVDAPTRTVVLPSAFRLSWEMVAEVNAKPFDDCATYVRAHRNATARRIRKLARQLPIAPWAASVKGTGELNLGLIVGETGELSQYATPAKLWKRMGLSVEGGQAFRRMRGVDNGFSPRRRTLMHNLGECLLRQNDGPYRDLYAARKAYELARTPDMQLAHAHNRALRYVEKRWLKDAWQEWQRVSSGVRAAPYEERSSPSLAGSLTIAQQPQSLGNAAGK